MVQARSARRRGRDARRRRCVRPGRGRGAHGAGTDPGRRRLFAHGAPRLVRRAVRPGAPLRDRVLDEGLRRSQRPEDRVDARRRRHRPRESGRGSKGSDRQGLQDHHGDNLVGDRAAACAARRPEQGPLHLGPGGVGRRHGRQQEHLPRGTAELSGRARRELVPRRRRREERHRVRAGLGLRGRQLPRRQPGDGKPRRAEGEPDSRARSRRRTSRRSLSRSSSRGRISCSSRGLGRRRRRCGAHSTSRASSRASTRS